MTMSSRSTANFVGITPKQLRVFLRTRTDLVSAPAPGTHYSLTLEQAELVKAAYWAKQRMTHTGERTEELLGEDGKGLPVGMLTMPTAREQFVALRRERAQRLHKLMHDASMTLPQMTPEQLAANGRVLAMGETE